MHARYYSPTVGRFLSFDPALDLKKTLPTPQAWNRYSYVRNNPLRFVDPTGQYTCDGTKDQCKAFEAGLMITRAAAAEATRAHLPGATRLNSIVSHYGKAGEKNDVSVVIGNFGGAMQSKTENGRSTIFVDAGNLRGLLAANNYVAIAQQATHEGDHNLTRLGSSQLETSHSRSDLEFAERSAYRAVGYINSALRIDDNNYKLWSRQFGWDPAYLEWMAQRSVADDCKTGCTP
jgi:uncharacterized protein RhaS with RHS repeats